MFDHLLKEIQKLDGTQISIDQPTDAEGYLARFCPQTECGFEFRIRNQDWQKLEGGLQAYCPRCRHAATVDQFSVPAEHEEYAHQVSAAEAEAKLHEAFRLDARDLERRQDRNAMVQLKLEPGTVRGPTSVPVPMLDALTTYITCSDCQCQFSVIGAGYFCPVCGHDSATHIVLQSIDTVVRLAQSLNEASAARETDLEAMTRQALLESSLQTLVGSFERFCRATFDSHQIVSKPKINFQNLELGSQAWECEFDCTYADFLSEADLATLTISFQRRHLLAHRQGMVDEKYLQDSGDDRYVVGQRIVLGVDEMQESADILKRLVVGLIDRSDQSDPYTSPANDSAAAIVRHRVPQPQPKLSLPASAVAKVLIEKSEHGCDNDPDIDADELRESAGQSTDDFDDAIEELCRLRYVYEHEGSQMYSISARDRLFVQLDRALGKYDPPDDAWVLSTHLVEKDQNDSLEQIAASFQWSPRRMNPAINYLIENGLVQNQEGANSYPWATFWVHTTRATRRFVRLHQQSETESG